MIGKSSLKGVWFSLFTQIPICHFVDGNARCFIGTKGRGEDYSQTVKAAYRAKCRTEHPDVGGTDGRFREIAWAYEDCTRLVHERNHINNGETPL
ncbi:hypothetical protein LSM04_004494 [Trypanosoma melophagium]|uniref:uncharacterized protein n=1 Tax=Trypanosoma melophagium TaxID=715481 RepID=UPI00351A8A32|nr:hypothetical protein LSM04_004494 [Trypanosoma melophagium]